MGLLVDGASLEEGYLTADGDGEHVGMRALVVLISFCTDLAYGQLP